MDFETYKSEVIKRAKEYLEKFSWFRGVCSNDIREYFDEGYSIEEAVELVELETIYHDGNLEDFLSDEK